MKHRIFARLFLSIVVAALTFAALWRFFPWHGSERSDFTGRKDVFRIYVLGESTAEGVPYEPRCNFGKIVSCAFGGRFNDRPIEVVDLGRGGTDATYSLEKTRQIVAMEPVPASAVVLVYSGHNEFLRSFKQPDLSKRERRLFDVPAVGAEDFAAIFTNFEACIIEIVDLLERSGIAVVLATPAANIADWEPNRSVLEDPEHEAPVREHLEAGEERLRGGDPERATAEFRAAVALEPRFAWAQARLGCALRRAGKTAEAFTAFRAADDCDARPDSATSAQIEFIRALARERGLPLVDAERLVIEASPDGLPGYALFWDNCHPKLATYALIGAGFADEIARRFRVPREHAAVDVEELARALGIDANIEARAMVKMACQCYGQSTFLWNPAARLARSRELLEGALERLPGDPQVLCTLAVLATLEGDMAKARGAWQIAQRADADLARSYLLDKRVVALLRGHGITDPKTMLAP